jgi:hypothetical protein
MNACALKYCTHWATGNNTGTRSGRTKHYDASSGLTLDWVWNCALDARNFKEILLRFLDALSNRCWNFFRFSVANANFAVAVTNNDKRGEAKATTTLDHLGDAVDCDYTLDKRALLDRCLSTTIAITTVTTLAAFATFASLISSHN